MPFTNTLLMRWVRRAQSAHRHPQGAADPHMRFSPASVPVVEQANFYIIGDLRGATMCYVVAHGSAYAQDYFVRNDHFMVPPGVTVAFSQPHGYALGFSITALRRAPPIPLGGSIGRVYDGGCLCPNYNLTKAMGSHLNGDAYAAHGHGMDYASAQAAAHALNTVFVTVRNRWWRAEVALEDAVKAIAKAAPRIRTIHSLVCRVTDGPRPEVWDARPSEWPDDLV